MHGQVPLYLIFHSSWPLGSRHHLHMKGGGGGGFKLVIMMYVHLQACCVIVCFSLITNAPLAVQKLSQFSLCLYNPANKEQRIMRYDMHHKN